MIAALILSALLAEGILTTAKPLTTSKPIQGTTSESRDLIQLPRLPHLPLFQDPSLLLLEPILIPRISASKRTAPPVDAPRCATVRTRDAIMSPLRIIEYYSYCISQDRVRVYCGYDSFDVSNSVVFDPVDIDCEVPAEICGQLGDYPPFSYAACIGAAQRAEVKIDLDDSWWPTESESSTSSVRSTANSKENVTVVSRARDSNTGKPVGAGATTFITSTKDHTITKVVNATGVFYAQSKPALIGPGEGFDIFFSPPDRNSAALVGVATIVFEIMLFVIVP